MSGFKHFRSSLATGVAALALAGVAAPAEASVTTITKSADGSAEAVHRQRDGDRSHYVERNVNEHGDEYIDSEGHLDSLGNRDQEGNDDCDVLHAGGVPNRRDL